jgi:DNA-binding response OmpR family regulator
MLIVEDELALRRGLRDTFVEEGYEVTVCADGNEASEVLLSRHFDLIILDLMLPGRSGLELLRELRGAGLNTPVLLLTARSDESDKVLGLELGADDYVTKPFGLRELIARVRALLRRQGRVAGAVTQFSLGAIRIDLEAFELKRDGEVHALSPKEAGMLALLHAELGKPVRRERFLDEVWGSESFVGPRTVDTHMLNLRNKLEPDPKQPRYLLTVHRIGYRLVGEGEA